MNRLGGWQRLGIVVSVLWCFAAIGFAANDYYKAYSYYLYLVESEATSVACREKARTMPSPEKSARACFLSESEITGHPIDRPPMPSVLPILALIFFPIAAGWVVIYLLVRVARWVREGFKSK